MNVLTPAKVSRPRLPPVYRRTRLFRAFDRGRDRPVFWVTGPAGAGKTTALASYLEARRIPTLWYEVDEGDVDAATVFHYLRLAAGRSAKARARIPAFSLEYAANLPVFARRFFEALFAALPARFALVLDNYQAAGGDPSWDEMVRQAIAALPPGARIFVGSRSEPPPALARSLASGQVARMDWEALRFSAAETRGLVALRSSRGNSRRNRRQVQDLLQVTDGWAAGMILLLSTPSGGALSAPIGTPAFEDIFDYFAAEVFARLDETTGAVLLRVAVLPGPTADAAERLSQVKGAGHILARLARQALFTECRGTSPVTYVFHPLFRAFLVRLAEQRLGAEQVRVLRQRAAGILAEQGQASPALELLRQAEDWEAAVPIVLEHAGRLMAEGQIRTLADWLARLPPEAFTADHRLALWQATVKLPIDPAASLPQWEEAFGRARAIGDADTAYAAWAGAVQAITLAEGDFSPLDGWLDWLDGPEARALPPATPDITAQVASAVLFACAARSPESRVARRWSARGAEILGLVTNQRARIQLTSALIFHHTQILQYASAEEHLREFRRTAQKAGLDPLVRLQLALAESLFHCYRPDMDACHRAVEEGLRLAAETGFGLMNGHFAIFGMNAAVFVGDRPSAERYHAVARQSARPTAFMLGFLRWAESWFQREFGPPLEALRAANEALEIARRCSFGSWTPLTHQAVASAEMALGRYQEAAKQLEAARDHGRNGDLPAHIEISQLVLEALLTRTSQPAGPWRERLAAALRISRERRFPVAACVPRALQAELCAAALAEGIEQEWVTEVIALLRLRPPPGLAPETAWPWPIKIHTLGRFDVHIDDRLLRFRGKVPRVPLRLLKALLASGSHPTPQEVLCDALWPDADGDTAAQSLDTALHRLRRLLGRQDAILVAENRVRLNLEVVWADCLAIPLLAAQVERAVAQREAHSTVQALVQSLLPLLQGPFLPEDDDLPGVAATRERLRRSLSRLPRSASLDTETTGRASVSHL